MRTKQAVTNKVNEIAKQYTSEPEKTRYQQAASRFRIPFWDPLLPRNRVSRTSTLDEGIWGVPEILAAERVWVKYPGVQDLKDIDNPLYAYKFQWDTLVKNGRERISDWRKDLVSL